MKKITVLLIIIISLGSCDPREPFGAYEGITTVKATIVNPRDSIGINDTVRLQFEVPDTIVYNGQKVAVTVTNNDGADCGVHLRKIDLSHAGSIGTPTGSITQATIGYLNPSENIFFQKAGNKLKAEYIFIPKTKGVFFLEQQTLGSLAVNNKQYLLSFDWNYGAINRNYQMLIDSAGPASNFNLFLQGHINDGYEIYGFKVN